MLSKIFLSGYFKPDEKAILEFRKVLKKLDKNVLGLLVERAMLESCGEYQRFIFDAVNNQCVMLGIDVASENKGYLATEILQHLFTSQKFGLLLCHAIKVWYDEKCV